MKAKVSTVPTAIRLPREMYDRLKQSPAGLAEEIRQRIDRTFREDEIDAPTRRLMLAIKHFSDLVKLQTGHDWYAHRAAHLVLRQAITSRLARLNSGEMEATFAPDELPKNRLFAPGSDDPRDMGLGIEATEFHTEPIDARELREITERAIRELRAMYPQSAQKEGDKP